MAAEQTVKATSTSAWKKAKKHFIRVPSGEWIAVVIPDLAKLIKADQIPQNLLDAALGAAGAQSATNKTPSVEDIVNDKEFADKLVQLTVVEPKLTDADLDEIPVEDKAMVVEIATRQRDLDAEGNHIGGLHKSDDFRKFRGLDDFESPLAGI